MADPGNRFTVLQEKADLLEKVGCLKKADKMREEIIGLFHSFLLVCLMPMPLKVPTCEIVLKGRASGG
jgi:hypothetical protein